MKYAGIIKNDLTAAPGVCLTFFAQGCPNHCPECHNPDTWDFDGGAEFTTETLNEVIEGLNANGIERTLCIMGGEPLAPQNELLTCLLISEVRKIYPNKLIYIWSGYTLEELLKRDSPKIKAILKQSDYLIDGPYIKELRDISLPLRGSSNQRVINLHEIDLLKK